MEMTDSRGVPIPRRACLDRFTPAERAIWDATQTVEEVGADPILTDAVVLLGQAREKVADYVDQKAAAQEASAARAASAEEFLKRVGTEGASIVSSNDCSHVEIALAQACHRFWVDERGYGYVLRPKQPQPSQAEGSASQATHRTEAGTRS